MKKAAGLSSGGYREFQIAQRLREPLLEPPFIALTVGANGGCVHRRLDIPREGGGIQSRKSEHRHHAVNDERGRCADTLGSAAKLLQHESNSSGSGTSPRNRVSGDMSND